MNKVGIIIKTEIDAEITPNASVLCFVQTFLMLFVKFGVISKKK